MNRSPAPIANLGMFPSSSQPAGAYDSTRGRIVTFDTDGTWEWDGANWTKKLAGGPGYRTASAMAYDSARGRAVLFGGLAAVGTPLSETWEWDGTTWVQRNPANVPSPRSGHAMAFDSARGRIVLFGGQASGGTLNDTWEWDGTNWAFLDPLVSPSPRRNFAMAYDVTRGLVVLFGGLSADNTTRLNDTWEWDGTSWTHRNPATSPAIRDSHAMAYDSAQGRVVLFGGTPSSFNDTWEWNGTNWAQRSPVTAPPETYGHALAYDSARRRVVLVSRYTWEWDGTNWAQRGPRPLPGTSPLGRLGHTLAYDSARAEVVLFGGSSSTGIDNETWMWNGASWLKRSPVTSPGARRDHATAFDASRGRLLLFGGNGSGNFGNETWEWDGTNWLQRTPVSSPGFRYAHAMAYDSVRSRVVLFGGVASTTYSNDTWEWDGTSWAQRTSATAPPGRYGHSMTYDSARNRVMLFGGTTGLGALPNDTWEWDGTSWTQRSPATAPSGRYEHATTYDVTRGRIVLFGGVGATSLNDTWEWDGTNWTQRSPSSTPSARSQHALAYDSARSRVVLFSGVSYLSDTWEWDGTTWTQKGPAAGPTARAEHAVAYDTTRNRLVLFGGAFNAGNSTLLGDTWEYDGSSWFYETPLPAPAARHGHALTFDKARSRAVLFGGSLGATGSVTADTWEYAGTNWSLATPATSPPARSLHSLAYDESRHQAVLFGGSDGSSLLPNDVWEYNGTNWSQKSFALAPSARLGPAMAYDAPRGRMLLFGGRTSATTDTLANDTWVYDGTSWLQKNPATAPTARYSHTLAYDSSRGRVVLFGGSTGATGPTSDAWEWDGTNWAQLQPAGPPDARSRQGMAFDPFRGRLVLFGGLANGTGYGSSDIWELPSDRPPAVAAFHAPDVPATGQTITLSSAFSDPDGDTATFRWLQTGGPHVTLNNATSSSASFATTVSTSYGFELSAFDGREFTAYTVGSFRVLPPPGIAVNPSTTRQVPGASISLAGSGTSPSGGTVTYSWTIASQTLGGSGATLSATNTANTTFTAPVAGVYIVSLTVLDSSGTSATSSVTLTVDTPPVASAGANQVRNIGTAVTLDASASSDADSDPLTYAWTRISGPSAPALSSAASFRTTFTPTVAGMYVYRVTVSDGRGATSTAGVTVTVNRPPVARAGTSRLVNAGTAVTLDASTSTDPDSDPLTYTWSRNGGTGPEVVLSVPDGARTTFTPPDRGTYPFLLTVSDGRTGISTAAVTITANALPVVTIAAPQTLHAGVRATLMATASDADNDLLTYSWTRAIPAGTGSSVTLSGLTSSSASFTSFVTGTYNFNLTVSDGRGGVVVTPVGVTLTNSPPTTFAVAGAQTANVGTAVPLTATASDPDGDPLTYQWTVTGPNSGSLVGATTLTPLFTPTAGGTYTLRLTVNDGRGGLATASLTLTASTIPVPNTGTNQLVNIGTRVTLSGSGSSNSDGSSFTYLWTQTSGPATAILA
ncbi:MAG: PKD domain-containing protein, partial [Candidatus Wallbacteria bacterium]|nr:PKD domain-containing protein [Candidatus Wallbacteria bacterium]